MVSVTDVQDKFEDTVTVNGVLIRMRTYVPSYSGTDYDNAYVTASGSDAWFMGMQQPLDIRNGGKDYKFIQQGLIQFDDSKVYIPGSISITSANKYKLWLGGSPSITTPYEIVENGVIPWNISGVDIYKKVYIRILNGGSFSNEY